MVLVNANIPHKRESLMFYLGVCEKGARVRSLHFLVPLDGGETRRTADPPSELWERKEQWPPSAFTLLTFVWLS